MSGPGSFSLRSYARTDVGRRRAANEDHYLCDDALGLWLVADGMGGHSAGEVASHETAEAVFCEIKRWREHPEQAPSAPERAVEAAVQAATYQVYGLAAQNLDTLGMGTTLSALVLSGDQLISAQVGDSRIYRIRAGEISLLTEDHTLVNWQLKQGIITPKQAQFSRKKNVITRAVGHKDYVEVDTGAWKLQAGDRYLLCSDGLHGYLEADELLVLTARDGQLRDAATAPRNGREQAAATDGERIVQALIDFANDRGGKDNITAIWLEVGVHEPT